MYMFEFYRQIRSISYGVQLFNDFIWFNVSWTQFTSHSKIPYTLSWWKFQKNLITYLKLQMPPSFISITFLLALGNSNMIPNLSYCFSGFLDQFCPNVDASSKSLQHKRVLHFFFHIEPQIGSFQWWTGNYYWKKIPPMVSGLPISLGAPAHR